MTVARPRRLRSRIWSAGLVAAACVAVLGFLRAPAAPATTVEGLDLAQMTARADLVVKGWVAGVETRRDSNDEIHTYVTLEGIELIHGTHLDSTLELRFFGGELEGERSYVAGMPTFSVGEHVLVFVRGNGSEMCPIVGWHQGSFRVAADPETGDEYLTDATGHPVLEVGGGTAIRYGEPRGKAPSGQGSAGIPDDPAAAVQAENSSSAPTPMPLADFLGVVDLLRGVASQPAAESPPVHPEGTPLDALAPASVVEKPRPVLGRPELPTAPPDREAFDEE